MDCFSKIQVLHVDDDTLFLDVSKRILATEGQFTIENAASVDNALAKIEKSSFDVIISDYDMPLKSGLDFLKEVKEKAPETPFILFTGKGSEEIAAQALNLGADRYINKQGNPETVYSELVFSIRQLCDKSKASRNDNKKLDFALAKAEVLIEKQNVVSGFVRHDIRNKLSIINCSLFLAKKYVCPNSELDIQFNQVCAAAKNIVHLLDFAQTYETAGSRGLFWIPISKAVEDAIALCCRLDELKINITGINFEVLADNAIVEIFHNFIDNSLKYGKNLTQIKIYTEQDATGSLSIVYEDNGGGIDPEMKRRLFQKEAGRGTGLGLYLIQRICKVYNWKVQENGETGKGVRFTISMEANQFRPLSGN